MYITSAFAQIQGPTGTDTADLAIATYRKTEAAMPEAAYSINADPLIFSLLAFGTLMLMACLYRTSILAMRKLGKDMSVFALPNSGNAKR